MLKPLPTLRQLRYLIALNQHHHFGKAAEACLATQSTVSTGLAELESLLGVTLVERTRRRVLMTPIGEQLAERAKGVLRDAEDMVDLAALFKHAPLCGPLSFGIIPTIAPYILPQALPQLRQAFPELKLHLREDLTANLLERLFAGELEAALIALPYAEDGLETLIVGRDPFLFVARPDHPLSAFEEITGSQIAEAGLVLLEEGHCLRDHSLAACSLAPNALRETILATSLATLVQMVASDLGVTILPKLALDHGVLAGTDLISRPLAAPSADRILALCWRDSSVRAAELRLLAPFFTP